jgi:hypothetical protein
MIICKKEKVYGCPSAVVSVCKYINYSRLHLIADLMNGGSRAGRWSLKIPDVASTPFVVLIAWLLWRERNDRIFNEAEVGLQWIVAGFAPLSDML